MTTVAVIIPVKNEELAIRTVLQRLEKHIPEAVICVCDNGSTDNTALVINDIVRQNSNIIFISEKKIGKGYAVKKAINAVEADIYCFVDGDMTYDTKDILKFIEMMQLEQLDLINVKRIPKDKGSFNFFRKFGNILYNKLFSCLFETSSSDILSGYKIVSKKFIKSFEIHSKGFEIETEFHISASKLGLREKEVCCNYFPRPEKSKSKLRFFNDGLKIISFLFKSYFQKNK